MARHNNREAILAAKVAEVETMLNAWAKGADVLDAGEKLVFSLRIEKVPILERDADDSAAFASTALPIEGRFSARGVRYVRPAVLAREQVEGLLKLFTRSSLGIMRIVLENRNNPVGHGSAFQYQGKINGILEAQTVVPDTKLRLVSHDGLFQLWVVEPT